MVEAKTKILLFGRTGSGKSTIANMLIKGNLDPPLLFGTSSGVRGKTELMQREETETMVVVDTVGFGEADGGTVSNEEAKLRLYDFFVQTTDEYNYFAYVHKWGKTDYFHENLWQFFKDAFKGVEDNFVIIFTNSKPDNIPKHLEDIQHDFSGCQRYVSVDFAGIDPDEDPSCAMARRKDARRNKSINCLKDEIMNLTSKPKPATAPIRETLSKGRLLLIGRYARAIDIVASSLVAGPETAAPTSTPVANSPATFKGLERSGRGWSVVSTVAFESYQHRISKMDDVDGAREIASHIIEAVQDGSYSHFIYVEGGGPVSKLDKLVWRILQGLLVEVQDNVVALIVNTKWPIVNTDLGNSNNLDNNTKAARKVRQRFKGCRFFLYLDLPVVCPGDAPDALQKKIKGRKDSLIVLERALCSSVTPRVGITVDIDDEISLMSLLTSFFVPIVQAVKHPKFLWLKEFDPLSKLSKSYRELSSEKSISLLSARQVQSATARTSQHGVEVDTSQPGVEVDTTQLVVGSSYMSHIYLEMTINVAPLESIHVEVDSHDQGWSSYPEDQGSYENSWTYGELSIMDHSQRFKEKRSVPRLRVYTNRHAISEWQLHKKDVCRTEPEGKQFLDNIKNGDKLILWLRSEFPGWANYSRRGLIRVTPATN